MYCAWPELRNCFSYFSPSFLTYVFSRSIPFRPSLAYTYMHIFDRWFSFLLKNNWASIFSRLHRRKKKKIELVGVSMPTWWTRKCKRNRTEISTGQCEIRKICTTKLQQDAQVRAHGHTYWVPWRVTARRERKSETERECKRMREEESAKGSLR